jgi:hypothetical protein
MGRGLTANGRRVTIDLTPTATNEVDRLRDITGLTTADLFRHALSLFRIYVDVRERGQQLCILDPDKVEIHIRLEFPLMVSSNRGG